MSLRTILLTLMDKIDMFQYFEVSFTKELKSFPNTTNEKRNEELVVDPPRFSDFQHL